ncbi:MAG: urease accessory protein UreE [Azospirillum sp.]|nr:urease accessory protein UreE [Azospirillum sp.]
MTATGDGQAALETAVAVTAAGQWPTALRRDTVVLDYDGRHRRRIRMTGQTGLEFLLDLADAAVLRDGDGLALSGGGFVEVRAAAEALAEITAATPRALARLAWHLGNRHLPAAIADDRILIRDDPVIVAMLHGLGALTRAVSAPFEPEGGAYSGGHHHG